MASWIRWTWVWVNSRNWWWTGKPDVLQSMGSQRVIHNWATELIWTEPGKSFYTIPSTTNKCVLSFEKPMSLFFFFNFILFLTFLFRYSSHIINCIQFSSVAHSCPTLCDPMDCSTSGFPVHHQLLELAQTHAHWVDDAIQPSHPLLSPSLHALSLSQDPSIGSSHQVAKVLELRL